MGLIDWWRNRRHPEPEPSPGPDPEPEERHRIGWRIRKLIEALKTFGSLFGNSWIIIVVVATIVGIVWYLAK